MSDGSEKQQKKFTISPFACRVFDEHPGGQSELLEQFAEQYAINRDVEEAAEKTRKMRLEDLTIQLYKSYDNVFSQFDSHEIQMTNDAVIRHAEKCALPKEDFVTIQKHLSWTVGNVTMDDVEALIHPDSDETVVDPTIVSEAAAEVDGA